MGLKRIEVTPELMALLFVPAPEMKHWWRHIQDGTGMPEGAEFVYGYWSDDHRSLNLVYSHPSFPETRYGTKLDRVEVWFESRAELPTPAAV